MKRIREQAAGGLKVRDAFTVSRTFTEEDVSRFAGMSRDYNPVHFDARFAQARNFPKPICHGLLTACLATEIGGQIGWLASGMNFRFKAPVYVSEKVVCAWVINALDPKGCARASVTFVKEDGSTVLEAEITGIVPTGEAQAVLRQLLSEGDPTNGIAAAE